VPNEPAHLEAGTETAASADSEETGREIFQLVAKDRAAKRDSETESRHRAPLLRLGTRLRAFADHEFFFVCRILGAR
jgi:hypothetical protein